MLHSKCRVTEKLLKLLANLLNDSISKNLQNTERLAELQQCKSDLYTLLNTTLRINQGRCNLEPNLAKGGKVSKIPLNGDDCDVLM